MSVRRRYEEIWFALKRFSVIFFNLWDQVHWGAIQGVRLVAGGIWTSFRVDKEIQSCLNQHQLLIDWRLRLKISTAATEGVYEKLAGKKRRCFFYIYCHIFLQTYKSFSNNIYQHEAWWAAHVSLSFTTCVKPVFTRVWCNLDARGRSQHPLHNSFTRETAGHGETT